MKSTIKNKTYDTETATNIAEASNDAPGNDFRAWWETLYLTSKGNWFLHARGGPLSKHAVNIYNGSTWGDFTVPMDREQALAWCSENNAQEAIDKHFSDLVEEA
jgi:hypothetical protein